MNRAFPAHLASVAARAGDALTACGFDALAIFSGRPANHFLDDYGWPFKVNPHFKLWAPLTDAPASFVCMSGFVAVLKNALCADYDPDRDGQYIRDEEDIERAGGVTADDRVEVQPWLAAEGRFSFVSSDPRAIDLACFASLKR